MLNVSLVQETIKELEEKDTTLANCEKLSWLYTVLDHQAQSIAEKELEDILPSYRQYTQTKLYYQQGIGEKARVESAMLDVCKEIREFIETLYSTTESAVERDYIKDTIETILEGL